MHLLLRNHRSWILPALFVAVSYVHRGQCKDGFFKPFFQKQKAGFVKTDEKTYHTTYEIDFEDALQQPEKLFKRLTDTVVTVVTDSPDESGSKETIVVPEIDWNFDNSREMVSKSKTTEETIVEVEKPVAKEEVVVVEKPLFKPKFLKKKIKKKLFCEEYLSSEEVTDETSVEVDLPKSKEETVIVGESISKPKFSAETFISKEKENVEVEITDDSSKEDTSTDDLSASKEITVGKPLWTPPSLAQKLKKKFQKPLVVSILKNFKLMLHLPIKLSKYEKKQSLGKKVKCDDDDYCELVT